MPYSYTEHISDIGISATGADLKSAFESGVEAMLNIMFDLRTINEVKSVGISAEAADIELLFVEVLNEVLSLQSVKGLALKRLEAWEIKRVKEGFAFRGSAFGEDIDLSRHEVRTEVKGATYSGLYYNGGEGGEHVLKCILDV